MQNFLSAYLFMFELMPENINFNSLLILTMSCSAVLFIKIKFIVITRTTINIKFKEGNQTN